MPPEFDLISVDTYAGWRPGSNGTDEVAAAKKIFGVIFPKLHGHQQVLVVPGTFACSNLSYFQLDEQAKNVVAKLDGYWSWVQQEKRIAGMLPVRCSRRPPVRQTPSSSAPVTDRAARVRFHFISGTSILGGDRSTRRRATWISAQPRWRRWWRSSKRSASRSSAAASCRPGRPLGSGD
eukprot:SAG22_NODE_1973_length_3224_cov_1.443840_3_plen_179_part_00